MNRDNLNYQNNLTSINNNSDILSSYPRTSNTKDYSTLNSIYLNSGIYNSQEKEENKELTKMKISVLLNEIKNAIENPEFTLNFQLIHMKCFNLNQLGLQLEFFEMLKSCLLHKLKKYAEELISFNNSVKEQLKINIESNNFFDKNNSDCKKFLNKFIEKYEEYKKMCVKISETISILDLKSHYLDKFKIKGEEDFHFLISNNKFISRSEIAKFNLVFKILFSLFFETLIFDENIQKELLKNFFASYRKIRNKFHNYISVNKEIEEYIFSTLNNSDKKNTLRTNSKDSSIGTFNNDKNVSSNLKLDENNIEIDCEIPNNNINTKHIDNLSITNFANLKKDDTIFKIKGILQKKKLLNNKNYSSLQNNLNHANQNLIELNENISTRKKIKIKIPLPDSIKAIFNILTDASAISVILNEEKLDDFMAKFDTLFISETKFFYSDYSKKYIEKIKRLEESNKASNNFNNKNNDESKKEKFSHYDIRILNYKSDNEIPIETSNANKKSNNNLIDLDLNAFRDNNKNNQNERMFINKKTPKENNLKNPGDTIQSSYNTYCNKNDILIENEIYCKFDSALESRNKINSYSKFKNEKIKNKSFTKTANKIPVSIEGFILQITLFLNFESELYFNYNNKEEILNLILEKTLEEQETSLSKGLRKFMDTQDLAIIKFLFALYSESEDFKEKFNKLLNNNVSNILSDLEKNHIIFNRFNRVEYVNFLFFVEEIFDTKKKFYLILKNCLASYSRSELIIKTALEKIVNKNFDFMENFVKLIHDEIKIAIKNKNPYRLKEFSEKFLAVYKLFNEKDLFEIEYRKYLSKRVLRNSSMVRETEHDFYEMLRKESGAIYTRKIEKILNEISVSYDLNVEYSQKYVGNFRKSLLSINDNNINNVCNIRESNFSTATAHCKNSFSNFNVNHNLAPVSNLNENCNYSNSVYVEEDKKSSAITPSLKPSNSSYSNACSSSSVNNFNYNDEKEKDHFKFTSNANRNNDNQSFNFNNFTPINANININNNNNFSLMSSISANTGKNTNNKPMVNSSIFKTTNNKNNINSSNNNSSNNPKYLENNPQQNPNQSIKQINNPNKFLIDINMKVVSSDSWLLENINIKNNKRLNISEVKKHEEFNLPQILNKYIRNFTEFYNSKFKNRQLKWIHEYSYAFMDMKSSNGKVYNIIASNYQMSFLCLFNKNKNKKIAFKEILSLLNANTKDNNKSNDNNKNYMQSLKSHFFPIFNSKLFLIQNKEKDEICEIEENDIVYLNTNFNLEENKLRLLNSIVEKKEVFVAEEKKETEVSHFVLEDRKHQLDAIIIKILKRNKIVDFEKLKALAIEEIKKFFVPETKFIKTRLENLIDRNFVKRNEEDHNCYEFI